MNGRRLWINAVIIVLQLLVFANKTGADNITENFDTDPGWTASGLPVNDNDFGYRQSSLAGGDAGEAGGFFSATNHLVWYGDNSIGNVTTDQAITASGILNILGVDAEYNNNVFIGHFAADDATLPRMLGFQILEEFSDDQGGDPPSFRIYYRITAPELEATGVPVEGPLFVITNTGETREWRYKYDPANGDHGSLTVSISGIGGNTVTVFLNEPQRQALNGLDSFGMAVMPQAQRPQQLELYIDNVTYSSESSSPLQPNVLLHKTVDNPTPNGDEPVKFTIEVSNTGTADAEQIAVVEKLPPDMAIPEGMAAFTSIGYYDAQTGIWDIGLLGIHQDAVMTLPAQIVTLPQPPCVVNIAYLNTDGTPAGTDEIILRRPDITRCVDLTIESTDASTAVPNPCAPEQFLIYRFKIKNGRSLPARNVKLTITETGSKAPGLEGKARECQGLTCTWPSLAGEMQVSFESDPFAPEQPVTHHLEAVIESSDGELTSENNWVTASIEVETRAPDCPSGGMDFSGLGSAGCFISTAAYGSSSHADVQVLRNFRDQVLLQTAWGRALVRFYYRHSPEIACVVAESPGLQLAVRSMLKPAVLAIRHPWKALLLLIAAAGMFVWIFSGHRHRGKA